jgi:hypothetical protein
MHQIRFDKISTGQCAALLAALLVCFNLGTLGNPPFWDDLIGLHAQAIFLADHRFDLAALRESGVFWDGGAWIYKWNILPYFYAALYLALPPPAVHVVGHLFNLGCLAAAGTLLFALLRHYRFAPQTALFWALAMLAEPLTAAQSAALGMEPPLILAGTLILHAAGTGRWKTALAGVLAAAAIKLTALIPAAALTVYFIFRFWRCPAERRAMARYAAAAGALTALLFLMARLDSDGVAGAERGDFSLLLARRIAEYFLFYFPLVGLLLAAAAAGVAFRIHRLIQTPGRESEQDRFLCFLVVLLGGFWCSFFLYSVPLPRYAAFATPPLIALVALLCPDRARLPAAALAAAVGVLLAGGRLYPALPPHLRYSGEFLERSRAFTGQIALDREICRTLAEKYGDAPVVAKWPYVQMLGDPRFGYVKKALPRLYSAGIVPKYLPEIKKYTGVELAESPDAVYIFICNSFEFFREFGVPLCPVGPVRVLFAGPDRKAPLLLYRKE